MKFEFSAGGIVYRHEQRTKNKELRTKSVLLCQHSQHHGWVFPKGLIESRSMNHESGVSKKEKKEETALREVEEETGVVGKIMQPLKEISYWYEMDGEKRKKTVYYFLMEYVSGDITKHDDEMENVEWLPIDKVEERLTYKSDKIVWQEAKKLIGGVA